MQLQIGKRYVLRSGRITSPLVTVDDLTYPFMGQVGTARLTWTRLGLYDVTDNAREPGSLDIVEEYVEPVSVNDGLTLGLYLVSTDADLGYDSFSSFVVCAPDEDTARNTDPMNGGVMDWSTEDGWPWQSYWCDSPDKVKVKHLGVASAGVVAGIVCSSYHAG